MFCKKYTHVFFVSVLNKWYEIRAIVKQMHIQFMYHCDITWDYEKYLSHFFYINMHQPVHVYIFHKGWFITKEFLKFI